MTAVATRVPCPEDCGYTMDSEGSVAAHVAMAHPGAAPAKAKRSARNVPTTSDSGDPDPAQSGHAPERGSTSGSPRIAELDLDLVDVGHNVRVNVAELEELAASIAEHGVLQPIKATGPHADGHYLVTWGQRRTLASRIAGRTTIPAIVLPPTADVDADGAARSIEQLVENLHRADLNPIDRAEAMRAVVDSGVSQADLARKLGIAPSTVANDLRLLNLDAGVLDAIRDGALSPAHGKAIASLPAKQQKELAKAVVDEKLSAHGLESRIKWKADEAKADEERVKRTERVVAKLPATLAGLGAGTSVYVGMDSYQYDRAPIAKAIKAAGFPTTEDYPYEPPKAGCDCLVVRLDIDGQKVTAKPGCSNNGHREAARKVDSLLDDEARAAFAARAEALQAEIERQLRAATLHPAIAALLERSTRPYSGGPDPADAIAAIAENVVRNWQVRERLTPELLAELGIEAAS